MPDKNYFIGLISGTSIDGVDCALVSFTDQQSAVIEATYSQSYPDALRKDLVNISESPQVTLKLLGETDIAVARCFADGVQNLLRSTNLSASDIIAIGSHGQTVYHKPASPLAFTLQLGDPNSIAAATGIATVADFRRKDMALGGQGAPLAPLFHRYFFGADATSRVIVNLGGIANITVLAQDSDLLGYDTGPANVLMDYWINSQRNLPIDQSGNWAAGGKVIPDLLEILLSEPYFSAPEPKSTGREYFNGQWLETHLKTLTLALDPQDVQRTLLELTAATVATEIENQLVPDEVLVCGGGAHNIALLNRLGELLPASKVCSTDARGLPPDWVEAMTFAWLAKLRMEETPVDARTITGAAHPAILGGVYLPG